MTQWPAKDAQASVPGLFVARTLVLLPPLENSQHPLSPSCCGVGSSQAACLFKRERGREVGRERTKSGSMREPRARALYSGVSRLAGQKSVIPAPRRHRPFQLALHVGSRALGYQDAVGTVHE